MRVSVDRAAHTNATHYACARTRSVREFTAHTAHAQRMRVSSMGKMEEPACALDVSVCVIGCESICSVYDNDVDTTQISLGERNAHSVNEPRGIALVCVEELRRNFDRSQCTFLFLCKYFARWHPSGHRHRVRVMMRTRAARFSLEIFIIQPMAQLIGRCFFLCFSLVCVCVHKLYCYDYDHATEQRYVASTASGAGEHLLFSIIT